MKNNKEELIDKLEEAKERLDHYQLEGNIEYIDLVKEEIEEYENEIEELEDNCSVTIDITAHDEILTFIGKIEDKVVKQWGYSKKDIENVIEENKQLKEENHKLKQWDCDKDTRNSRQRVANAKQLKTIVKQNELLDKIKYELECFRNSFDEEDEAYEECDRIVNLFKGDE